jgi:hypothetical protein
MNEIIITLLAFSLVGAAALSFNWLLNRKQLQAMREARQSLIDRAKELQPANVDCFLDQCDISRIDKPAARLILDFLGGLLEVPAESLASNIYMGELFSLPPSHHDPELHPFASDLVEGLASLSVKECWQQRWSDKSDLPRSENELIRFIMSMTVPQVVNFFAPLMRRN